MERFKFKNRKINMLIMIVLNICITNDLVYSDNTVDSKVKIRELILI